MNRSHPKYSIEQKNEIVIAYLNDELSQSQIEKQFDIVHSSLQAWVKQYREFGTTVDRRGAPKKLKEKKTRVKKLELNSMNKEELIQYIQSGEAIKKAVAYLRKQKKNTK